MSHRTNALRQLRLATHFGAGLADCVKALEAARGDAVKAEAVLLAPAATKSWLLPDADLEVARWWRRILVRVELCLDVGPKTYLAARSFRVSPEALGELTACLEQLLAGRGVTPERPLLRVSWNTLLIAARLLHLLPAGRRPDDDGCENACFGHATCRRWRIQLYRRLSRVQHPEGTTTDSWGTP